MGFTYRDIPSVIAPLMQMPRVHGDNSANRLADRTEQARQFDVTTQRLRDNEATRAKEEARRQARIEEAQRQELERRMRQEEEEALRRLDKDQDDYDIEGASIAAERLRQLPGYEVELLKPEPKTQSSLAQSLQAAIDANDALAAEAPAELPDGYAPIEAPIEAPAGPRPTVMQPVPVPPSLPQALPGSRQGPAADEPDEPEPPVKALEPALQVEPEDDGRLGDDSGQTIVVRKGGREVGRFTVPGQTQYKRYTGETRDRLPEESDKVLWDHASALVGPEKLPFDQARAKTWETYMRLKAMAAKLEAVQINARRPRGGGGRPVNDFNAGVDDGKQAFEPLRRIGENFSFISDHLQGLDERNPILSSAALIGLAKGAHQGDRLTDKDIQMLNVNPSIWAKFKNLVSLETGEEIDADTRRRMTSALISIRRQFKQRAAEEYSALRERFGYLKDARPGYAEGFRSVAPSATARLPGLFRPEHWGAVSSKAGAVSSKAGAKKPTLDFNQ